MAYPSTFEDLQSAVVAKLRLDATADATRVRDWINQAYTQVCIETEANQTSGTMVLTKGSSSYTMPAGILRIHEMYVTPVGAAQWAPLQAISLNKMLRLRQSGGGTPNVQNGSVTHYTLLGLAELEVYPTPPGADVITVYYTALPTLLSAPTDVPILQEPYATKCLEYGALAEGADFRSDPSEAEYRQLFELWMGKLRTHLARRQGNLPGQMEIVGGTSLAPHDPSTDVRSQGV